MNIIRYFTLTLLIFATLAFVPSSFAKEVKIIYFIPNDRDERVDIDTSLDTLIKNAQTFFEENMDNHGFGKLTFSFETDIDGNAVVHRVYGTHDTTFYNLNFREVFSEVAQQFDPNNNICFIYFEKDGVLSGGVGSAYNGGAGGVAMVYALDIGSTVHELGHAFGLSHDSRPFVDKTVVPNSVTTDISTEMVRSYCAAELLSVSQYFGGSGSSLAPTTINMLDPQRHSDSIKLRFEILDSDGLHQAQLFISAGPGIIACKALSGHNETVEFVLTNAVATRLNNNRFVSLFVADEAGYFALKTFPIDLTQLLPPPKEILIPDTGLAALIRPKLGLASDAAFTQNNMLELVIVEVHHTTISDLTGLEYALNLSIFRLLSSQISDLSPLSRLPKLSGLSLSGSQINDISPLTNLKDLWQLSLTGNNISDITPIQGLTRLEDLSLSGNNISDITPLVALTNLQQLNLSYNNISDVSPLAGLTNLQQLNLYGNPIKDREPLLALLQKNPDVKIYLEQGGEPLPVTLSHFRAEHTAAGVLLKWTTESELDNAGFYIYRSETKDGEFKVVNPQIIQGAGTTGERTEYSWTDTTAKPNTVYYYRIEDVSHAGDRKQLATVRLRGLVSAKDKQLTKWSDLKH